MRTVLRPEATRPKRRRRPPLSWMVKYHLLYRPLARVLPRRISAMVRVRNEAEFLLASVESIAPLADQIVIVENLSTDRTPEIIADLKGRHRGKIVVHRYEWEIRRVGVETRRLAEAPGAQDSPHLSANYYNWCLGKCAMPFVLKWDGDMIATDELAVAIKAWRRSRRPILIFQGANVHPDREHLAAARIADKAALGASLEAPGIPAWAASMAFDYPEPRLFPRYFARYEMGLGWTQRLASPWLGPTVRDRSCIVHPQPCYLHMKFCKAAPLANYSDDLAEAIAGNMACGRPLDPAWKAVLQRWCPQMDPRP